MEKIPMVCTLCDWVIEQNQQAFYGVRLADGSWKFGWCCTDHPVADADVIIASEGCLLRFVKEHPETKELIAELFETFYDGVSCAYSKRSTSQPASHPHRVV